MAQRHCIFHMRHALPLLCAPRKQQAILGRGGHRTIFYQLCLHPHHPSHIIQPPRVKQPLAPPARRLTFGCADPVVFSHRDLRLHSRLCASGCAPRRAATERLEVALAAETEGALKVPGTQMTMIHVKLHCMRDMADRQCRVAAARCVCCMLCGARCQAQVVCCMQ